MTAPLLEVDFQATVVEAAGALGWQHLHVRRTIGRGKRWVTATNLVGWPDLLLWHERQGRVVAIELKSEAGRATTEQLEVLRSLEAAGVETHVFRPSQWEELCSVLRARPSVDGVELRRRAGAS